MKNIDLRYERNYFCRRSDWSITHNDVSSYLSTFTKTKPH